MATVEAEEREYVHPPAAGASGNRGKKHQAGLVYGDVWDGNASVNSNTGEPVIFDPTPLYAYNEYEMAPWWVSRHKMTSEYVAEYIKHHPRSAPVEDFQDRGAVYGL